MTTGSTSSAALESRNWLDLPEDVTAQILMKLDAIDILSSVPQVCVLWWRLCKDSSMWQRINIVGKHDDLLLLGYDLAKMCREAVNRSEGQLIEINIDYICTDELLQYIVERDSYYCFETKLGLQHYALVLNLNGSWLLRRYKLAEISEITNCFPSCADQATSSAYV
ncbi:hypothetical protein ACFE04_031313 [Oxalis oulophora]